jgi:hypothetical protein
MSDEVKKVGPFELQTPHDAALLVTALESRADALDKLAKGNEKESYGREARIIESDAAAIRSRILPVFQRQAELPLAKTEDLAKAVKGKISTLVIPAMNNVPVDPKKTKEEQEEIFRDRAMRLVDTLAERIAGALEEAAQSGWDEGYQARHMTPTALAMGNLDALGGR